MMPNKRLWLLIGAGLVASVIILIASFMRPQETTEQTNQAGVDPSITTAPTGPEAPISEPGEETTEEQDFSSPYIKNYVVLANNFNVSDALFINSTVQKFAVAHSFSLEGLELDQTSFKKNSETEWGFMMRDANGNQIFYVTVTRLPEGNIKVEEFLR